MSESAVRVLQMGPGLGVRGGVSAVERVIIEQLDHRIDIRHMATMEDGSILRKLWVFAQAIVGLRRELRGKNPPLVHIHFASRGSTLRKLILAWMVLKTGTPLVLHAHGASFDLFFENLHPLLRRWVAATLRRADRVVVLSSQWRDFYVRNCALPPERVEILHNPARFPAEVSDRRVRERIQFVFLGRIGQRKGAFDLLDAFKALPPSVRLRARLIMAGDGEVAELKRRAAALPNDSALVFSWLDAERCAALLNESDVFVLPSYNEGIPMAMLEAMAYGLPLVVTPVGGIPDVVDDGVEGLFVTPGDVAQLTETMRMLIENPERRLQLGRQARQRAQSFDAAHYGESLLQLYGRLQ